MSRRPTAVLLLCALMAGAFAPALSAEPRWAVAIAPSGDELSLELAIDPEARALGYMGREHVGPDEGMLFVFEQVDRHGIWMKNCLVPLDLIWLDDRFRVLEVALDRPPCDPERRCPTTQPLRPARYVLEVASGNAERLGLGPGSQLVLLTEVPEP